MSCYNHDVPRFGSWLSTTTSKSWDETLVVVKNEGEQAGYVMRKKAEAVRRREAGEFQETKREPAMEEEDLFCIKLPQSESLSREGKLLRSTRIYDMLDGGSQAPAHSHLVPHCPREERPRSNEVGREGTANPDKLINDLHTSMTGTSLDPKVAFKVDHAAPVDINESPKTQDVNSLAMILYSGNELNTVICDLHKLGLKRNAAEEWESGNSKRRKIVANLPSPAPDLYFC